MADRIPLIVDSSSNQVKELPAGDSIILADNENVKIGTGSDLKLYHNATDSFIDNGTGDLKLRTPNNFRVTDLSNNKMILCQDGGETQLYHDGTEKLNTDATGITVSGNIIYSGASLTAEGTLSDGSTITWNVSTDPIAKVTLAGNRTIAAPTNPLGSGQYISLLIIQDGTGSRTLTWNGIYEFKDDTAPTLTTTATMSDLFTFRYYAGSTKWVEVGRNQNLTV